MLKKINALGISLSDSIKRKPIAFVVLILVMTIAVFISGIAYKIIMAGIVGERNYGVLIQYATKNVELDKIDEVKEKFGLDFLRVSCAVLLNGNSVAIRFSDEETILDTETKDNAIIIANNLAEELALNVGDMITLGGTDFRISDISDSNVVAKNTQIANVEEYFLSYSSENRILSRSSINAINKTLKAVALPEGEKFWVSIILFLLIGMLLFAFCILNITCASIFTFNNNKKKIGVIKFLGAKSSMQVALMSQEIALMSLISYFLAMPLIEPITNLFKSTFVNFVLFPIDYLYLFIIDFFIVIVVSVITMTCKVRQKTTKVEG